MARTLPKLGEELVLQIEQAWNRTHLDWICKSLLVVRLTKVVGESPGKPVRLWLIDEHRYGLLPVIRRGLGNQVK